MWLIVSIKKKQYVIKLYVLLISHANIHQITQLAPVRWAYVPHSNQAKVVNLSIILFCCSFRNQKELREDETYFGSQKCLKMPDIELQSDALKRVLNSSLKSSALLCILLFKYILCTQKPLELTIEFIAFGLSSLFCQLAISNILFPCLVLLKLFLSYLFTLP